MAVRIGMGLGRFVFDDIDGFRRWLDLCEEGGIDSIWQSDQVIASRPSPEPLALAAMVAGATQRLKFGMNAVVLGFRDPVVFARQCATIDYLSEGRFLPVVGVGAANSPGWRATGRSPRGRGARANEALEIITRLWTGEEVSFEGEHYRLEGAVISPTPVQSPLPLWIGGSSKAAIARTLRFGSGWLAGLQTLEEACETAATIRRAAEEAGQHIPLDHYGATVLYRIETGAGAKADDLPESPLLVAGDADDVIERIDAYVAGGITKFVAIPLVRTEAEWFEQTRLLDQVVIPAVAKA